MAWSGHFFSPYTSTPPLPVKPPVVHLTAEGIFRVTPPRIWYNFKHRLIGALLNLNPPYAYS